MDKNILITGATGFLGSHLLKFLYKNTNYNFVVLKRTKSDNKKIKSLLNNKRIVFIDIDEITHEKCFEYLNSKKIKINAIIHCAVDYGRNTTCDKILQTNLIFPISLIEQAIKNNVEVFINTDSYFNKENRTYMYLQNYSLSKKSLILWLKYFSSKIKILNLILEHIYGENDNQQKFVANSINQIAIKKVDNIDVTFGEQKRDFIYVEDVCNAYKVALEYAFKHFFRYKSLEVGTSNAISIKEFLNKIKDISNSNTIINYGAIPYREDEIMLSVADNLELCDMGWKPNYTIEQGIRKTIEESYNEIANNCNTDL